MNLLSGQSNFFFDIIVIMKTTIHKIIFINASREKVWNTMLGDATYREWTTAFCPGSYYKGSWEDGSKILFLGPNPETGAEGGMVSRIKESRLHEFVSIEHLGMIMDGVEDLESDTVKEWKGFLENYTFTEKDAGTELIIDTDTTEAEAKNMETMWDKALISLKELAEK